MLLSLESKLYITVGLSLDMYIYTHISVSVSYEVLEKMKLHTLVVPKLGCLHSATQKSVVLFVAN